eukprot:jgi/Botrbrau1/8397/Bobra.0237s0018.1
MDYLNSSEPPPQRPPTSDFEAVNVGVDEPDSYAHDTLTGVMQPNVETLQTSYIRYNGMPDAHVNSPEWTLAESIRHRHGYSNQQSFLPKQNEPISVQMRITKSPAAFGFPIVQRKPFRPPFTVRLAITYQGYFNLPVVVEAHVMTDVQHTKPQLWSPDSASTEKHSELDHAKMQRNLKGGDQPGGPDGEPVTLVEEFEFVDLKFVKSSRMNKRWLVFSCKVENDLIYVVYGLATVIISRRTDQYEKAYESLRGVAPNMQKKQRVHKQLELPDRQRSAYRDGEDGEHGQAQYVSRETAKHWIENSYAQAGFTRPLTEEDKDALLLKARLVHDKDLISSDSKEWQNFRDWFQKSLRALMEVAYIWNQVDPPLIFNFTVTRTDAEERLKSECEGAFLLRICSEPGSFCISCKMKDSHNVEHMLVDIVDLCKNPLERYVMMHPSADILVDAHGGRHAKGVIFGGIRHPQAAPVGLLGAEEAGLDFQNAGMPWMAPQLSHMMEYHQHHHPLSLAVVDPPTPQGHPGFRQPVMAPRGPFDSVIPPFGDDRMPPTVAYGTMSTLSMDPYRHGNLPPPGYN